MLFNKKCYVNMSDDLSIKSIIHDLKYAIADSKSPAGLLTVVVPKAGMGLVVMEDIPELIEELKAVMDVFGGESGEFKDSLKREREIAPVIQSAMLGRTLHIPFQESQLLLDPNDNVLLVDFEKKGGRKEFVIQIMSEAPAQEPKQGGAMPTNMNQG